MGEGDAVFDREDWFADSRGEGRRMRARWHGEEGLVVLSLWQGSSCTGTFRLPVHDAARLIGTLAGSLADAARAPGPAPIPPRPWREAFLGWFRRRPAAPVLPLRIVRRR
jgi:hypothetical protein